MPRRFACPLALLAALSAAATAQEKSVELLRDDFSRYPAGLLSAPIGQQNPAIQEYHYLAHRGVPLAPWANAIVYLDSWAAGDEDGKTYVEQHLSPDNIRMYPRLLSPLFVTGDPEWEDVDVEASVRPLSTAEMCGVVFRYATNRRHFLFCLTGGNKAQLVLKLPFETEFRVLGRRELGSVDFAYDTTRYYRMRVVNRGPKIECFIDGKLVISAEDGAILRGKAGLSANCPARYMDFRASCSEPAAAGIQKRIRERDEELAKLRADNPRPKLWKKFDTPGFGAGRNCRFGDLDGDGQIDMLIGQNVPKVDGGNFVGISCLTAVTFDGKVIWQLGRPDPRNGLLTADCPFQIHDLDGDGRNEVVMIRDFKLQVLDGATGKVKASTWMPVDPSSPKVKAFELKERPYELSPGDSLSFIDFSGKGRRSEIVIKDRYRNFWVFDAQLKRLWTGTGQIGHFPFAYADGSGRDKLAIGYALWDHTGKQLWSRDAELKDHADGVAIGNFSGDPKAEPMGYYAGSDEGFVLINFKGEIVKHHRIGHPQNAAICRVRPDLPGLQYACINFWKNPGITTIMDHAGNILIQGEPIHGGSILTPVNWRGDGQEFLLLSGNSREGGMIDGQLRRAVMFPDDGHPDLACAALDLTGDARDEIVVWDQQRVWVYTQDRPFAGAKVYAPQRNPHGNDSNYRTVVSVPGWKDAGK